MIDEDVDVVVVGGGPSGLTAAWALRRAGVSSVLVIEREIAAGGIPRHSDHPGYGVRDLHRWMSGPHYARALVERTLACGAEIRTSAMVTGWDEGSLLVTSPDRLMRIRARSVVLATGARERPRTARLVAGDRPDGVLTTGQLQNLVHLQHRSPGTQAVVVGAEAVSWSAVLTLREAGCSTALMTTRFSQPEAYGAMTTAGRLALRVPVARRTEVVRIIGRERVEAVEILHCDTGLRRAVACDTVVFTGDWIPDNELARSRGVFVHATHLGPVTDQQFRTSQAGVFAIGNVAHPVDTADMAALDGVHVANAVQQFLSDGTWRGGVVRLDALDPFEWVTPGFVSPGSAHGAPLRMWTDQHQVAPRIAIRQAGRVVRTKRTRWSMAPGRIFRVPAAVLEGIDPAGGDVTIGLA